MSNVTVSVSKRIERPIDVVRTHFWDMRHHQETPVHQGVQFAVHDQSESGCRYRQTTRMLGMVFVDECENSWSDDGAMVNRTISGSNAGTVTTISFEAQGEDATVVQMALEKPTAGFERLLAPLLAYVVRRRFERALEEDRVDLEERGYPVRCPARGQPVFQ